MAAIVFDAPKAERRLLDAGASPELAEATADLMSDAVVHNLDALVTKDYLDHVLDARFSQQDANMVKRFHEQDIKFDRRFHDLQIQFRVMQVLQALLVAGVFLPQLRVFFPSAVLTGGRSLTDFESITPSRTGPRNSPPTGTVNRAELSLHPANGQQVGALRGFRVRPFTLHTVRPS